MIYLGNIFQGLGGGGGGTVTGADNGLSLSGSIVELGGNPLIKDTNIDLAGFKLNFGTNPTGNNIQIDDTANKVSLSASNGTDQGNVTLEDGIAAMSFNNGIGIDSRVSFAAAGSFFFYTNDNSVEQLTQLSADGTGAEMIYQTAGVISSRQTWTDGSNLSSVTDDASFTSEIGISSGEGIIVATDFSGNQSQIKGGNGTVSLIVFEGVLNNDRDFLMSYLTGNPTKFVDNIENLWCVYDADYSAGSVSNPRSIPDVGYINGLVTPVVASAKVLGVTASQNLITFTVPGGPSTLYRIGGGLDVVSGIGTCGVTYSYANSNGNAQGPIILINPFAGAGTSGQAFVSDIFCSGGSTISINYVLTGTATVNIATLIQKLV